MVTSVNRATCEPNPACHAESRVLRKAGKRATLWVLRFTRDGKLSMAKPCESCETLIRMQQVREVNFSNWDGNMEQVKYG